MNNNKPFSSSSSYVNTFLEKQRRNYHDDHLVMKETSNLAIDKNDIDVDDDSTTISINDYNYNENYIKEKDDNYKLFIQWR